jgi:hypothetical protein
VQQMGEIYSYAQHVLAWLGQDRQMAISLAWFGHDRKSSSALQWEDINIEQLDCLLENEYWDRAWITPKLVLAKDIWIVATDRALYYPRLLRLARRSGRPRLKYHALNDVEHAKRFQTKLIYNVMRFQGKRCSDIRDRIYSL